MRLDVKAKCVMLVILIIPFLGTFSSSTSLEIEVISGFWTKKPSIGPSGRFDHGMVYNTQFKKILMYGGMNETTIDSALQTQSFADTWIYDPLADTWTNMSPLFHPSQRFGHSMAYDSAADSVILFGGQIKYGGSYRDDTWVYELATNTWTEMAPSTSPSARRHHSMVYDSAVNRVILFGGYNGSSNPRDTWMYDILMNKWTQLNPLTQPSGIERHSMVYNSAADRVILFGSVYRSSYSWDTWIYDLISNTWTQLHPSTSPDGRIECGMVYDPISDKVVLFGGWGGYVGSEGINFADTWTFDLTSVAKTSPSAPRSLIALGGKNFVSLSWSAPLNDGGSAISHYKVYRGTTSGSYMSLGITANTTYNDSTIIGGLTYYYVVTAVNSIGESGLSNETSVTSTITTTTPKSGTFPNFLFVLAFLGILGVITRKYRKS